MQIPQVIFFIFTAVISVGVLIQAIVLVGMFFAVKKTTAEARELSGQLRQHLVPILSTSRNLIEDSTPKIKTATTNLVEASQLVRSQAEQINSTFVRIAGAAEAQVTRVDEMATAVLDGLTQATAAVQHGITSPLRQVSGVLNGLRAGIHVLRKKDHPPRVESDGGNFV